MLKFIILSVSLFYSSVTVGQEIAVLKYGGGGDWYSNPTALPNLAKFCNETINTKIVATPNAVTPSSVDLFNYPYIHMTGHGNVFFSNEDASNLRIYLLSGGFLHIDDNYGLDTYVRKEIKKIFPDTPLKELSGNHPLFQTKFNFPNGLPKIHEHNNERPQALGITYQGRLVLLYTFESDLSDGWEDSEIHNDPEEIRQKALKMGANIIKYAFEN